MDSTQASLLDESIDGDVAAIEDELAHLRARGEASAEVAQKPKRTPLPEHLPRTVIYHEPDATQCGYGCEMKRIGEDVAEKWTMCLASLRSSVTFAASGYAVNARR